MKQVLSEKDIRLQLLMCSGSEEHYRHPLFKQVVYTEGIYLMSELCNANWLLVDMLANISLLKSKHDFIFIKLYKDKDLSCCSLVFEDGNNNPVRKPISYTYTDFPLADWKESKERNNKLNPAITFFYSNDVLYLPSEH